MLRQQLLKSYIPAFLLLTIFAFLADSSIENKSITFDETAHITAGYSYWKTGDYRLNPQNGLLPQVLESIPLLFDNFTFPSLQQAAWKSRNVWEMGDQFINRSGNDVVKMVRMSRRVVIILGVITGILVFTWSKYLWGNHGALFSLGIYTLSPTILAHSRLATSDMAASLGFLLSAAAIWKLSHKISAGNVLFAGIAISFLALSKMSVVLIAPISLLIITARVLSDAPVYIAYIRQPENKIASLTIFSITIILVFFCVLFFINIAHAGHTEKEIFNWNILDQVSTPARLLITAFLDAGMIPESYLYGLTHVLAHSYTRLAFAGGHISTNGWWWFFPFAFLVKTPTSILLSGALSIWLLLRSGDSIFAILKHKHPLYNTIPLFMFIVVYCSFAMISNINIGQRHLLPIYPAIFILCGSILSRITKKRLLIVTSIYALLVYESLSIYPNYLAYFNLLSGGPSKGYKMLVDSSLDWGQDLPLLRKFLDKNKDKQNASYLAYFGTANPSVYGIDIRTLPGFLELHRRPDISPLKPGIYAISATILQLGYNPPEAVGKWSDIQENQYQILSTRFKNGSKKAFIDSSDIDSYTKYERLRLGRLLHYLRHIKPDTFLGYSILIYHLAEDDLEKALIRPVEFPMRL